jgi:hypothetical protein
VPDELLVPLEQPATASATPVFPPDRHAAEVVTWLRDHAVA